MYGPARKPVNRVLSERKVTRRGYDYVDFKAFP